ncbi:MAG: peptide deformylase [Methylococcales bacterium]|nr:peptide deformylase [Methylococcales bacterium]
MKQNYKIAQLGHPILRQQAEHVEDVCSPGIVDLIEYMLKTLAETNGVGLAAPQIFESTCIVIIASRPSKRYPLAPKMEAVVMINPSFEVLLKTKHKDWEGCLSIPGIRALVPRYQKIKISYLDQQGENQQLIAEDFIARIFQHEYDHLKGLVYLDRVENNKDIISEEEFQKLMDAN